MRVANWTAGLLALMVPVACTSISGADDDGDGSKSGGAPGSGGAVANSGGSATDAGDAFGGEAGSSFGGLGGASGGSSSGGGGGSAGSGGGAVEGLSWPIDWPVDCEPGSTCYDIGYPDADADGVAFDCDDPGYAGHQGTDIPITWEQMDAGVAVRAAAAGTVFFVSDGRYDRCPDEDHPHCQQPTSVEPGGVSGHSVCTELGPYCNPPGAGGECFHCFAGGNVIVLLHDGVEGVFATRYDHLRNGSVLVEVGQQVARGEKIAEVGSAGNSTGPHLHFEVWGSGYYDVVEPWAGECGPNTTKSLWVHDPPWEE